MSLYIDVFHGNSHLFTTEDFENYGRMEKTYTILRKHLPVADGYKLRVTICLQARIVVPQDEFNTAVRNGKGKRFPDESKKQIPKSYAGCVATL
ncbi:hypothetical protein [Paraflavitalea pollutisoli]|uniref:hypothetical protein n=1 Tax=Paraflavitalea pollutisoli TaxID=3034143 RepID=UPI0023EA7DA6|nr:hypothetical protein [Paraflavitalea sp. H1-2-19X]